MAASGSGGTTSATEKASPTAGKTLRLDPTTPLCHVEDRREVDLAENLLEIELHRQLARRKTTNGMEKLNSSPRSCKS
jgi:hypothetical protein